MIYKVKSDLGEVKTVSIGLKERQQYCLMNDRGEDIYKVDGDRMWVFVPPVLERVKTSSERANAKESKRW